MQQRCSLEGCAGAAIASLDNSFYCYQHFLTISYGRLEIISVQIHEPLFHQFQAEATGRFLEDCMRTAADVACSVTTSTNLERARILDVLLWASELHGRLRRGPRLQVRVSVLLRSEALGKFWEEKTETQLVSRHGAQLACQHVVAAGDALTCVRVDNEARAEARVVWTRRRISGEMEIGIEFLTDTNFWQLGSLSPAAVPAIPESSKRI